jgi:hypothetical protein
MFFIRNDLYVWLRIGPWGHGEVRNGGFPDWLVGEKTRQNDPVYLGHVRTFFNEIGRQAAGLVWKDGGPIVGVQLENEYHPASDGLAHMQRLLQLAREAGLDVPFYTAASGGVKSVQKRRYEDRTAAWTGVRTQKGRRGLSAGGGEG